MTDEFNATGQETKPEVDVPTLSKHARECGKILTNSEQEIVFSFTTGWQEQGQTWARPAPDGAASRQQEDASPEKLQNLLTSTTVTAKRIAAVIDVTAKLIGWKRKDSRHVHWRQRRGRAFAGRSQRCVLQCAVSVPRDPTWCAAVTAQRESWARSSRPKTPALAALSASVTYIMPASSQVTHSPTAGKYSWRSSSLAKCWLCKEREKKVTSTVAR